MCLADEFRARLRVAHYLYCICLNPKNCRLPHQYWQRVRIRSRWAHMAFGDSCGPAFDDPNHSNGTLLFYIDVSLNCTSFGVAYTMVLDYWYWWKYKSNIAMNHQFNSTHLSNSKNMDPKWVNTQCKCLK